MSNTNLLVSNQYTIEAGGYGNIDFYVIECNSLDGIKDIYVAKYKNSLMDKCGGKNEKEIGFNSNNGYDIGRM